MFTMISTLELKEMLKNWKTCNSTDYAKNMIKAIKEELKLRKG